MRSDQVIDLIKDGVSPSKGDWADIGAGTGAFTIALRDLLKSGTVYALDKSPHALWRLDRTPAVDIRVVEGDFNRSMEFPVVDGVVMANALHYSDNHEATLRNVISHIKPGGALILVEYEAKHANRWVPYPIDLDGFTELCSKLGLKLPVELHRVQSAFGHDHIYSAITYV